MAEKPKHTTWLQAIEDAAKERSIELPPFIRKPMGLAITEPGGNGRFITVRYRLVPKADAERDGIQWALRQEGIDSLDLAFRQPAIPEKDSVVSILAILKGWLLDNWSIERARDSIRQAILRQSSNKLINEHNQICFSDVPGFNVCWAGSHPYQPGYCFGSEDGRLLLTDENAKELNPPFEASSAASPINGFASCGNFFAVSSPNDFCMWHLLSPESGKIERAAIPAQCRSLSVTKDGVFLAPLATNGIMIVSSVTDSRKTLVIGHDADDYLSCNRVTVLDKPTRGQLLACAVGQKGVAFIDFENGEGTGVIETVGYEDWDVIDVCPLRSKQPAISPIALAAIDKDGTIALFRDPSKEKRPLTMKYAGISGQIRRILSSRGHLLVLTSEALYLLANVAEDCLEGTLNKHNPTHVTGLRLRGIDANIHRDQQVLVVVEGHGVARIGLSGIEQNVPEKPKGYDALKFDYVVSNPPYRVREQKTELAGV